MYRVGSGRVGPKSGPWWAPTLASLVGRHRVKVGSRSGQGQDPLGVATKKNYVPHYKNCPNQSKYMIMWQCDNPKCTRIVIIITSRGLRHNFDHQGTHLWPSDHRSSAIKHPFYPNADIMPPCHQTRVGRVGSGSLWEADPDQWGRPTIAPGQPGSWSGRAGSWSVGLGPVHH